MKPILLLIISLAGAASACSGNIACVADDDCFKGEVCVRDVCERPSLTNNGATNSETSASSNTPNSSNDANANSTMGTNSSMGTNNSTGTNNSPNTNSSPGTNNASGTNNTTGTNSTSGACRGSTFDSCPPDDDSVSPTMLSGDFGRGCVMPNDSFEGGTIESDGVICPLEDSDRFSVSVNPCASTPFFLDVLVAPREVCAPADFEIDVSLSGSANDCANGNGVIMCTDGEPGTKEASLVVQPGTSGVVLYVDVLPIAENLMFEYDVSVTFRQ